jgi:hypothetical protein
LLRDPKTFIVLRIPQAGAQVNRSAPAVPSAASFEIDAPSPVNAATAALLVGGRYPERGRRWWSPAIGLSRSWHRRGGRSSAGCRHSDER